jgi:glycosyltransferase involved in cell wall biosynthesis
MSNPPRIAIVTPIMPYPPDSGSKLRIYHLARLMAQRGFKLFLLSFDPHYQKAVPERLKEWFEDVRIVEASSSRECFTPIAKWRNAIWGMPFPLRPGLAENIRTILTDWNPDFIQAEKTIGAAYLDIPFLRERGIRCIWEEGGVHHLSYEREADIKKSYIARLIYKRRYSRLKAFETRMLKLIDAVVAVSVEEAELLSSMNSQTKIIMVPNGVDENITLEEPPLPDKRQWCAFFCGNLNYLPNRDAVELYIHEIMPRLNAKGIALDFVVAGANVPDSLAEQAHVNPQLKLLGYVDSIDLHLKKYALFVNPMRLGGGTRLKMLEAMAYGMACVSTGVGAEGILIKNRKHAFVSDTPESLAADIEFLVFHPVQAAELAKAGRELVLREYLWPKCAANLISFYEETHLRRKAFP